MAITEVGFGAHGFSFGTGDGDDEVIIGEIEVGKIELAERTEEFAEGGGENLEPASANIGVVKPVNSLFAVLRSVNRGGRIHTMELEENFFGTAGGGEPITG